MNKNILIKINNIKNINKNVNKNVNKKHNIIKTNNEIYFVLSSITFLQLYLSIVDYASKSNIKSIFYIRKNSKEYACPILNKRNNKILNEILKKYDIISRDIKDIINLQNGILFVVDGDIYGPQEQNKKESVLNTYKLSKKIKIISLCEHMNFLWAYKKFVDKVTYIIFPNDIYAKKYNLISQKNIFLGNTKFDNILDKDEIYKKYNIDSTNKYLLFLYPKTKYINSYKINSSNILNLFNIFHEIGYKIIVKTRPKDIIYTGCNGDYNIISDTYPNESLELMKISELCIFFSSSAIDECVMMEIPSIDFVVDTEIEKRLEFLYDDKIVQQIKNWKNINREEINNVLNILDKKNSSIFKQIKEKYLFTHINSAKNILNFLIC